MKKEFDGKRGGYDYRCGRVAGCYNLWKNGKYVKSVDVETFVNLKKDNWYFFAAGGKQDRFR